MSFSGGTQGAARHAAAALLTLALWAFAQPTPALTGTPVVVGSKVFTESVILAEIVTQTLRRAGIPAEHRRELGGSRVLFDALRNGEIDAYTEYSGTLYQELLGPPAPGQTPEQQLAAEHLAVASHLGFSDNYVLGMRAALAARDHIQTLSDLQRFAHLRLAFSNEFMSRADGWAGLRRFYALPQQGVRGLDHELAYRALEAGDIDITDLYSTDPEIIRYGLTVLRDDRHFFPPYSALLMVRDSVSPAARRALARLDGTISTEAMARMNASVLLDHRTESEVAAQFLDRLLGPARAGPAASTRWSEFLTYTGEHLLLTGVALAAAVLIGLPLGILAARRPPVARVVLGAAGVIQTVPSLALLVFMIPLLGIGFAPAVVALFLYSLLPIIRNTCSGLLDIPRPLRESAIALGLTEWARLRLIDLPLATRSVLAGIKTAAVICVGTATLGALVGAGGYGQPILTGIRLNDIGLILEGAIPAALLALLVQWLFDALERLLLPHPRTG
ncbi:MAG TPA: glycine betaine ABC transporter substrate-binding protein [Steroidobacteraceae bacterium]|nr:glycine betaine ABC transporter substrate-binding protein [Steroidobacteraceae bacterium]